MSELGTYDRLRGTWSFLFDSRHGGWRIANPSSAQLGTVSLSVFAQNTDDPSRVDRQVVGNRQSYLVPHDGESPEQFDKRVKLATYINLVGPVVDSYTDSICPQTRRTLGSLDPLLKNVDGEGREWGDIVAEIASWACTYGFVGCALDMHKNGSGIKSTIVHPSAIAWIEYDDAGMCEVAFLESAYVDATSTYTTARVWVMTRSQVFVCEGRYSSSVQLGQAKSMFTPVGTPTALPSSLKGRVPFTFCYANRDTSVKIPLGISLVDDVARAAQLVYNELSRIEEYHRKATAFLAIPTREMAGVLDPTTTVKVGPDSAFGYSADTGSPQWVSPPSEMPQEIRNHCQFVVTTAFRTVGLQVESDSSAQVQSGEALRIRSRDFEAKAGRIAKNIQRWERETLDMCADFIGVTPDYELTYGKRFVLPDSGEDLARAVLLLQTFGTQLGTVGMTALTKQAVDASLTLSEEDLETIVTEVHTKIVEAGTDTQKKEIFAYDYEAGIIKVNEARATKGLPPLPDGERLITTQPTSAPVVP